MSRISSGTAYTTKSGISVKTTINERATASERSHSDNAKAVEEEENEEGEEEEEEEMSVCEKETTPVIKDPTPKQILGMFQWNGDNLYDHLKRLLDLLISTRPENVMDYLDQYSREIRFKKPPEDPLVFLPNGVKLGKMYGLIYPTSEEEAVFKPKITDPWDFVYYFEEMGICISREEIYHITLALRKLALVEGLSLVRFWGKIFGLERSYIVAECELTQDEIQKRIAMAAEQYGEEEEEEEEEEESTYSHLDQPLGLSDIFKKQSEGYFDEEEGEIERLVYKKLEKYVKPPVPRPKKPEVKKTVPEKQGEGVNKKVYYVCHEAGDEWILLPNVKPEQIVTARVIRKYFKGYLLSKVESYPPFQGTERELLRAQIARISAGTQISPLGFYQFGGGGEEGNAVGEEQEGGEIVANLDYDPIPPQDLLKTEFWVHHIHHILRIGRTTYWHEPRDMGEEEIEEEFQGEQQDVTKDEERGPPILTPISEDISQEMIPPWTIKTSSAMLPATGVVVVRSNLWPGAYAFAKGRIFENIYIGWGLKLSVGGFNPTYLPEQQVEYELGPEIMEMTDPTPEMEDEWREAHKPRPIILGSPEEEGGEGEQPEFDEEYDDNP